MGGDLLKGATKLLKSDTDLKELRKLEELENKQTTKEAIKFIKLKMGFIEIYRNQRI
jgi:uncharacterized Zn ribbon protein